MDPTTSLFAVFVVVAAAAVIAVHPRSRAYGFAAWVVAAVLAGLFAPASALGWLPLENPLIVARLLQIAMFGMGATLTAGDFVRILQMPKAVVLGAVLQFSIMPCLGWAVSKALGLPPELTLGMILLGSSPGGISSNVITYLARGNVALSVTMTAVSTLIAPVMTPLMVYAYARQTIDLDYVEMFSSILATVVAPVAAGLVANAVLTRCKADRRIAERILAVTSMIAICLICGLIAVRSRAEIVHVGGVLLLAVAIHNVCGYLLGYGASRLMGVNVQDSRTIAIEVGLQNGGLAANLATEVLKMPSAAIVPALFSAVMNVTGSVLAAIWAHRPPRDEPRGDRRG
jgi:BASS family bile acid:Na+ symporter